jgi:hypothetical protein
MNDPAPPPQSRGFAWPRPWLAGFLAAVVAGYVCFLVPHMSPYAGGSDPSGYFNSARLLRQGRLFTTPRVLPGHSADEFGAYSVVPLGFVLRPEDRLVPTYPIGYPLQLMAAGLVSGDQAVTVVNVFTALASGLLLFAFCRRLGLSAGLALGGVGLLWLCPLFLYAVFLPMSDLSALGWSLAALYCALGAREGWKWGLLCGAAVGVAVLVRPTNLLLAAPVLVALGFRPKAWLAVGLGGLPLAALLGLYNWQAYGSPWATGYGNVWGGFGPGHLAHNSVHFAYWIPWLLSPLVVLAAAAPFLATGRQRGLVVLLVWFASLTGFYVFYYHSGETWWYLRFILPAFPALIVAALVVLDAAGRAAGLRPRPLVAALAALLVLAGGWQIRQIRQLDVLDIADGERSYPEAARWARQHLPANAAIFCMQVSGAFFYYTDFLLLRWEMILPEKFDALIAAVARQDRPVYVALFPYETERAQASLGGHWTKLTTVGQVTFWQRLP